MIINFPQMNVFINALPKFRPHRTFFKDIRMIVFNISGTIVDDRDIVSRSLFNTIKKYNPTIEESDIHHIPGFNNHEVLDFYLYNNSLCNYENSKKEIHNTFDAELLEQYKNNPNIKLVSDNIFKLFQNIRKQNIRVAINTDYNKDIQHTILQRFNLYDSIDSYVCSDDVKLGKPYPYMIYSLMEKNKIISPKHVLKIGHTHEDIFEGYNAKCHATIGVLSGVGTTSTLRTKFIINDVCDINVLDYHSIVNNKID